MLGKINNKESMQDYNFLAPHQLDSPITEGIAAWLAKGYIW